MNHRTIWKAGVGTGEEPVLHVTIGSGLIGTERPLRTTAGLRVESVIANANEIVIGTVIVTETGIDMADLIVVVAVVTSAVEVVALVAVPEMEEIASKLTRRHTT